MRRGLTSALALCAALVTPIALADESSDYFRAYQRVMDGLQAGECKANLAKASELAASPLLTTAISRAGQTAFLNALIDCAYAEGDMATAFKAAQAWHALDPNDAMAEAVRLDLGPGQEQPEAAVDAFMTLVRISPAYLRSLEVRDVWDVINAADKLENADERKFELHQALVRIGYSAPPPAHDGHLRLAHAELLLARGDIESARARLAPVTDLSLLVRLRIERQFDVLRGDRAYEARLDLKAAAAQNVLAARKLAEEQADLLELVEEYVSALHAALRPEEALAAADAAIAKHAANPTAFKDADDKLRWLLNRRGYILHDLGRSAEARASLAEAAGLTEHGEPNVSNIINYMLVLVDEGAAKEAAELLPKIGKASPYGQGWIEAGRVCVGVQLQDEAMQKAGLDWLREHEADNRSAYSRALLCANALDDSAAFFVKRLNDPEARGEALMALQDFINPNPAQSPVLKVLLERLAAVRARPEVQAAVNAVGRIEQIPVHLSSGDI